MVVDEESIGTTNTPGCGAKVLRGDGALERYLAQANAKLNDKAVWSIQWWSQGRLAGAIVSLLC